MGELPTRNIIVCSDGYCRVDYKSKECCAVCSKKDECAERCEPVSDNLSLQLCTHQQSIRTDKLDYFKPAGNKGLRYNTPCHNCDDPLSEDEADSYTHDGEHYCETCYDEMFTDCGYCGHTFYHEDMKYVRSREYYICESCDEEYFSYCVECDETFHVDETEVNAGGDTVCDWCWGRLYITCSNCGDGYKEVDIRETDVEGAMLCPDCWSVLVVTCEVCEETGHRADMRGHGDYTLLCADCYEDESRPEESEENSQGGN